MQNNISKINTIYKSLLSLLVLSLCGFGIFIYYVDPFTNYAALYQLFIILTLILFFGILFSILHVRLNILKNFNFVQEIEKHVFNSIIFASSVSFFLLLVYTNSINLISFTIFCASLAGYCTFEFLE